MTYQAHPDEANTAANRAKWAAAEVAAMAGAGYDFPAGSQRYFDELDGVWIVTLANGEIVEFGNC